MGGRGSASGVTTAGAGAGVAVQSITNAKDFDGVKDYMAREYGIPIADALKDINLDSLKEAASGIEFIIKELPQLMQGNTYFIHTLGGGEQGSNAYASATLSGYINMNRDKFADKTTVDQSYLHDVSTGFHPEGTTSGSIVTHEAGHLIERALIYKNVGADSDVWAKIDRTKAWNKSTYSTKIISEAAKVAKKTAAGKGKTNDQLVAQVSRYATKNRSEALAECVADYQANGSNAKPLSVAVWNVLKKEFG